MTQREPGPPPSDRIRIAILFGGRSAEHEVSVVSARSVIDALDPARFEAVPIGIDREGGWHLLAAPPALLPGSGTLPAVEQGTGRAVELDTTGEAALVAEDGSREPVDVVFPILHGPFGEDGTVQGMLELAGIPYVGAGVLGSALGMDKAVQKVVLAAHGLPVVPHVVVHERDWRDDPDEVVAKAAHLGFPLFAKPAALGSSVGISKVKDPADLREAMEECFRYGRKALLERGMEGIREIECGVLGNDDPVASVPGEILPAGDEGMSRVDFFLRDPDELIVNEINTIPGFTEVSMYPKLWEASGLPYADLVDRLVELAIERHEREAKRA